MSDSQSPMFMVDGDDPAMQQACANARANFRYFWREVARDRRRIVPALGFACVKAPFADPVGDGPDGKSRVEQMWV
ncbi:MAG: DUF2314 domain-containing protein, partial [Gemmataceae bacterium]|nr:DUF2314 domain-containing protein [Gemmataceae bacterium]